MEEKSVSICVIGGGGFIGTALRKHFSALGYDIVTIGRSLNVPTLDQEEYFSVAEYSYKQLEEILAAKDFSAVIDLAYTSVPNTSYEDPVKDFSENLTNVIRHLEFARVVKARKFIYVSSGGTVYGDSQQKLFTEDSPNFPLSPYGVTKLACERYVYLYHRIHGVPSIIIRPSNIYGPGQKPFRGQGLISTALGLAWKGEPIHIFGKGEHVRDYLYIEDFCAGLLETIRYGVPGEIYNLGSGYGVSIGEIIDHINGVLGREGLHLTRKFLPERPFDVHFNVLDNKKVAAISNWQPETDLESGITQTWKWIKEYLKQHH